MCADGSSTRRFRTPFIARLQERAELEVLLVQAASGKGDLALLTGEPGLGKTRLAAEIAAAAERRGMLPLWGRCYELETAPPYTPFVEILEDALRRVGSDTFRTALGDAAVEVSKLLPDLRLRFPDIPRAVQVPPEHERRHLFNSVWAALERLARDWPLLLILEDLHWSDAASLWLLHHMAPRLAHAPVVVLGTFRDNHVSPHGALAAVLDSLIRQRLARLIALQPLQVSEVRLMLEALSGRPPPDLVVKAVFEETEGNPFFVEELFYDDLSRASEGRATLFDRSGAWREDVPGNAPRVPETVRLILSRRVARLSEPARAALEVAALVGKIFDYPLLEAACEHQAEVVLAAVEEAEDAGLIVWAGAEGEPRYAFAHELIRQTIVSGISTARQQRMHLRLAAALENIGAHAVEQRAPDIARHLLAAGPMADSQATVRHLSVAARQAIVSAAYEDAIGSCRAGLALLNKSARSEDGLQFDLLLLLGEAQAKAGFIADARETFGRAAVVACDLGDARRLARAAIGLAEHTAQGGLTDEVAAALLDDAADALAGEDSPLLAMVTARRALSLTWTDEPERMSRLSQDALAMARRVGDPEALACALEARHRVLSAPDGLNERAAVASEMVSLADRLEHRALQLQSRLLYLNDLLEVGDAIAARAELDTFARLAGESRVPLHAWHLLNLQVTQTLVSGDFPSAERLAARALALGEGAEIETARHLFFAQMFGVRREQGRLEEILEALRDLAQRYPSMLGWRCVLAYAYSELGRRALARTEFERLAARDFDELPRDATWLSSVAFLAHVCAFLRDQGRAQTLRRLLAPFAGQNVVVVGTGLYSGPVSLYLGMLAVVLNDTSDALAQFAEALDAAMRMGARPFVGRVHLERARALLTRRRRLDLISARDDLRKAAAIFEELGMTVHLERARALLARSQADTASFVVYPDRLTAREAEVLRLIADGRTNREIAETLTLSVRTVGRHITNIYGKIGARNRAEATAYALRHGFVVLGDAS